MLQANNLIRGKIVSGDYLKINISPVDGTEAAQASFLSDKVLVDVFARAKEIKGEIKNDYSELDRLAKFIKQNHQKFVNLIIKDAGFTEKDSKDLVDCSIEFCEDYHLHLKELSMKDIITSFSFRKGLSKKIKLTSSPYGLIAVTTPRNTPLITELTAIVHALWSGNVLVLRPSPGVAGTMSLLIEGLVKSFNQETLERLNIIFSDAKAFIDTSLDYSNLVHYIGSTKYLEGTLIAGIKRGVKVLVDGDGCSLVLVDSSADIEKAAMSCYEGLVRCNAQICISIRTIIVEQTVYEKFLSIFLDLIKKTNVCPPGLNKQSDMGPLFSSAQVDNILEIAKKYQVLYGQLTPLEFGSNYISPIVVQLEPTDRNFLKESLFGPMVGVASFKGDGWKGWLQENPINLTDVVFSKDEEFIKEFLAISKSPRKIVNADPTLESIFEPWGAFLPAGWNDVSYWYYKYRNFYQLVREME